MERKPYIHIEYKDNEIQVFMGGRRIDILEMLSIAIKDFLGEDAEFYLEETLEIIRLITEDKIRNEET